jgi:diacylglycerol O-acyltransferase
LTSADLMMLWPEDAGWREDIGALAIIDGPVRLDTLRTLVQERLHLAPRFRQLLSIPRRGLGGPHWIDAPRFDIADHVDVEQLPPGSDDTALLAAVERLRIRPFDRSRPLWEMWLLPGLDGNRVGFYVKMHHTMADGVAGVLLLGAFLDLEASVPDGAPVAWTPAPPPTSRDLLVDNLTHHATAVARRVAHPIAWYRELHATYASLRNVLGQPPMPATSVNQRIGATRRMALVRGDLARAKQAAHHHGATVNDVLMSAVTGGYRALLVHRSEPVDGVVLRASVPVSLHDDHDKDVANDDGMMFVPLPLDIPDAATRLEWIANRTRELRHDVYRPPSGPIVSSRLAQHVMWSRFDHQRMSNAYVANIPGPTTPLYLAGARVEAVFPVVPILGNITIGIGAMSYAGQFNIAIVADEAACPDLDIFTAGVADAMAALEPPGAT